jgi:hypothetical protein
VLVAFMKPESAATRVCGRDIEGGRESVFLKDRHHCCFKVGKRVVESQHNGPDEAVARGKPASKLARGNGLIPLGGQVIHLGSEIRRADNETRKARGGPGGNAVVHEYRHITRPKSGAGAKAAFCCSGSVDLWTIHF